MNVLVTGGFGCIGSYVMRDLLKSGHRVVCYDLFPDRTIPNMVLADDQLSAVTFAQGDVTDLPAMLRAVKTHGVDRIVHLASWQIPAAAANPSLALKIITEGTINVFEAARLMDLSRVVWASSVAVFGSPDDYGNRPTVNDDPHYPKSIYGANKSLCEFYGRYYYEQYGCDILGLRFTSVFGVGRTRGLSSFTTKMIEAAAYGEPYEVPFGEDIVDWQYVEDVSRSIQMTLETKSPKTRNFTVKGDFRAVTDGVEHLKKLVPGARLTVKGGKFGIQWQYDAERIAEEIGFRPQYDMEKGIERTLARFQELRPLLRP